MNYKPIGRKFTDLSGKRSGKLLVLFPVGVRNAHIHYKCKCDCGGEKEVPAHHIRQERVKSCGCMAHTVNFKGLSTLPEYKTWRQVVRRCHNPKAPNYRLYGERGIFVCDRWRNDPHAFIADMGKRPSDKHSIDRIDNDGPYSPENCRWATSSQQTRNRRIAVWLELNGVRKLLVDWAEETGLAYGTIKERLRRGYSVEEALDPELHKGNARSEPRIEMSGVKRTANEWAMMFGIPVSTVRYRLKKGKPIWEALSQ